MEIAYFQPGEPGHRIDGFTTAVEGGRTWVVTHSIVVDETWTMRSARVTGRSASGTREVELQTDGHGQWWVDGQVDQRLNGCLDVDLESSAMTNALPLHRMGLQIGAAAEAPAAYVRALDLSVSRLEQRYLRLPDDGPRQRYDYAAPAFDVSCGLVYDESGLVLDYSGVAVRAI